MGLDFTVFEYDKKLEASSRNNNSYYDKGKQLLYLRKPWHFFNCLYCVEEGDDELEGYDTATAVQSCIGGYRISREKFIRAFEISLSTKGGKGFEEYSWQSSHDDEFIEKIRTLIETTKCDFFISW